MDDFDSLKRDAERYRNLRELAWEGTLKTAARMGIPLEMTKDQFFEYFDSGKGISFDGQVKLPNITTAK
jgi:hypothetical protein